MLKDYMISRQRNFLEMASVSLYAVVERFITDNNKMLTKAKDDLYTRKNILKTLRRKFTLCFKNVAPSVAIEMSTCFHLSGNCQIEISYNLIRMAETCHEHVDNNFKPLPSKSLSHKKC